MDPKELEKLVDLGLVEFARGEAESALARWQQVLDADPGHPRAVDYLQTIGALPADAPPPPASDPVWETDGNLPLLSLDELADLETGSDGLPVAPGEPPQVPSGEYDMVDDDAASALPAAGTWASGRYEAVPPDPDALFALAQSEFDRMEFEESLFHCEQVLDMRPERQDAAALAKRNRDFLLARFGQYIGDLDQVPAFGPAAQALDDQSMDPVQAFIMRMVDGETTIQTIVDRAPGFEQFEIFRTLHFLIENSIIELRGL